MGLRLRKSRTKKSRSSALLSRGLRQMTRRLFMLHGPQGWWAGVPAFEVALGAILTQNTNWKNVEKALRSLADNACLTPEALRRLSVRRLEKVILPAGYYKQKAKKLKLFASFVLSECRGDLRHLLKFPDPREKLLAQWGIGPETADTILLYGLDYPVFVVDVYTRRLLVHLTGDQSYLECPYEEIQGLCSAAISENVKDWQEVHALIVAWGKRAKK